MKVGLLTFHSAHNYGAALQAYATQEILRELGHNIHVIDYRPRYLIKQPYFPSSRNRSLSIKVKILIEGIICIFWRYKRRRGFFKFINSKLKLTQRVSIAEGYIYDYEYDAFIMGSDQIWNIDLTNGFDNFYWGNFNTKLKSRKISYAASMANYQLTNDQKETMAKLLANFHAISVREEPLKDFIYENFKLQANTVLDPTLLLDISKWRKISSPPLKKKYVLAYAISMRDEVIELAKVLAKQLDATIVELTVNVDKGAFINSFQTATPEEFLGLFDNSECVATSSFHGTAFSIVFNKPFYSIAHGTDKDTRQKTILGKLGLQERLIQKGSKPEFKSIDYNSVNISLDDLRKKSIAFLQRNLSDN